MNLATPFEVNDKDKAYLCSLGVELLVLFGSQAQGTASSGSDYDFGVALFSGSSLLRKQAYDGLYDFLSKKINRLVNIDIVFLPEAPLELQNHVAKYGVVLYEQKTHTFGRFRERVMLLYADFAPFRQVFQKATFDRIRP